MASTILDIAVYPLTGKAYAIETAKLHQIDIATNTINTTNPWPHTLSDTPGEGVVFYNRNIAGSYGPDILYIVDTDIGSMGAEDLTDNWLSTGSISLPKPANGAGLTATKPHPYLIWQQYLWVANGYKLAKLDGATGDNGTWTAAALTLPITWIITALFPSKYHIGICVWETDPSTPKDVNSGYRSNSYVLLWDGVSTTYNQLIPVGDNKITNAINKDGIVYLFTEKRNTAGYLLNLNDNGTERIKELKCNIGGVGTDSYVSWASPLVHASEVWDDKILFGASNYGVVMGYGGKTIGDSKALVQPFAFIANTVDSITGTLKAVATDKIYVSFKNATDTSYGIKYYSTGYSTAGLFKANYTDFGQKVRVNYVKFYFKPLVTSDSITVGLDIDYGTAVTLKDNANASTITYSADGAITSKKFKVGRDCHAFRPTITWNAGGVAISKIIIDYDFLND